MSNPKRKTKLNKSTVSFFKTKQTACICRVSYFGGFHRAEGDVGEELGRRGRCQVQRRPVHVRVLFAKHIRIIDFEHFVQTEFAHSLSTQK